eukprot:SAG25_NODE_832_length_5152_cov_2.209381_7_plen_182_part_00
MWLSFASDRKVLRRRGRAAAVCRGHTVRRHPARPAHAAAVWLLAAGCVAVARARVVALLHGPSSSSQSARPPLPRAPSHTHDTVLAELTPSLRIVGQRAILRLLDFPLAGHDMLPVAGPGCWLKPHPPRCTVNNLGPNSLLGPIACCLPAGPAMGNQFLIQKFGKLTDSQSQRLTRMAVPS